MPFKKKEKMPIFPDPPKKDGGEGNSEEKTKQEITEEQLKIVQQIEQFQNNGLFRINLLDLKAKQNNIFIEFGQKLLSKLDEIKVALEKLQS